MRIDKFISNNSDYSRSQIHAAIRKGNVFLNNAVVQSPNEKVSIKDLICIDGKIIETQSPRFIMLNKPESYLSANQDSHQPTLIDLIDLPHKDTLQIVGRLDKDTTGLVLLTDDGQWNHQITSPHRAHTKTYRLTTEQELTESLIAQFAEGLWLDGETKKTLPAKLFIVDARTADLILCEGKYHQVKRMLAAVGNHVTSLHRSHIGQLALDSQLKPGEYRHLTEAERLLVSQPAEGSLL